MTYECLVNPPTFTKPVSLGDLLRAKLAECQPPRTKLEQAQAYAAQVRARKPGMQVRRVANAHA